MTPTSSGRKPGPLTATYRLQLHAGFTFDDARDVVPYLARLGVSHLYLSPVLTARPGSQHGYDVADPRAANPELGGDDGFRRLADAAHAQSLGILLDVVPNHMGAGPSNPFWMDVLRWGRESRFAGVFDVDWNVPGREGLVVLPVLGDHLDAVIARDELKVVRRDDELRVAYYEHEWPIDPRTASDVDAFAGDDGRGRLRALLDAQHWRLVHWRRGPQELNYRRFFDIGELVAVRAEDPDVFALTHGWVLDRVAEGLVDGLRVDHIDGLRDPQAYLARLRAALDERRPDEALPIFVEKILSPGEPLRVAWSTDGTTGYEFLNQLEGVFVDASGMAKLDAAYRRVLRVSERVDFHEVAVRGKEHVLRRAFDTDVRRLVRLLAPAARHVAPRLPRAMVYEAVLQLATQLAVYRTYVRPSGADDPFALDAAPDDLRWIAEAQARAQGRGAVDRFAMQFVVDVLRGDWPHRDDAATERARRAAYEFALRFQQTSGPATAKGIEDTALYRWFPLASLNEVGGEPSRDLSTAVDALHAGNAERLARWPRHLLAIETHDTKRSADARSRLDALSEIADEWNATVARWRRRHAPLRTVSHRRAAPDANAEYLFYQSAVALWPTNAPTGDERATLRERLASYMKKAAREAKAQTSWTDADARYEDALDAFVAALVEGDAGAPFRDELARLVARVAPAARWTSLSRVLLQTASPGTPDTYQGAELWSRALVDPDNRRPVDFGERAALLDAMPAAGDAAAALLEAADDGRLKLHVLSSMLRLRRDDPALFAEGTYTPVHAAGERAAHVVAFARELGGRGALVVATRLALVLRPDGRPPVGADVWRDTTITIPGAAGRPLVDALTGRAVDVGADGGLHLADALAVLPLACLRW